MRLIINTLSASHWNTIYELFENCEELSVAVAFLKKSGLSELLEPLLPLLEKAVPVTFMVGIDFGLTDPAALRQFFQLVNDLPSL